jgi:hypothetical protein
MDIAEDLRKTHQEILAAIEGLTPEQLTAPNSFGRWSAREVMLHLAMWAGECLKAISVWKTGHSYDWDYATDYLAFNDFWIKTCHHLSLGQVTQMLNIHYLSLTNELAGIDENIWQKRGGCPKWLSEIAIGHSREHIDRLHEYRNRILHKISI